MGISVQITIHTDSSAAKGIAERDGIGRRLAFYLGVALPLWFGWQVATVLGATLGARLPSAWGLDFAIPLTFMALVMPALRDAPSWAAAATGGAVAVAAHDLPWNLGLIAGALAGIAAGMAGALIRGDEPEAP